MTTKPKILTAVLFLLAYSVAVVTESQAQPTPDSATVTIHTPATSQVFHSGDDIMVTGEIVVNNPGCLYDVSTFMHFGPWGSSPTRVFPQPPYTTYPFDTEHPFMPGSSEIKAPHVTAPTCITLPSKPGTSAGRSEANK